MKILPVFFLLFFPFVDLPAQVFPVSVSLQLRLLTEEKYSLVLSDAYTGMDLMAPTKIANFESQILKLGLTEPKWGILSLKTESDSLLVSSDPFLITDKLTEITVDNTAAVSSPDVRPKKLELSIV